MRKRETILCSKAGICSASVGSCDAWGGGGGYSGVVVVDFLSVLRSISVSLRVMAIPCFVLPSDLRNSMIG